MKINAYQESYLNNVQENLGYMFHYGINECKIDPNDFSQYFLISGVANQIASGNPNYLTGKSGVELGIEVISNIRRDINLTNPLFLTKTSKEFWAGWTLSYIQWKANKSFDEILEQLPYTDMLEKYTTYHTASVDKLYEDIMNDYLKPVSNLKKIRKRNSLSQKDLSKFSNVSLRSIQMYEQKRNDINKAQGITLFNLSRVLNCKMEDLLDS